VDWTTVFQYLPDYALWTRSDYVYNLMWGLVGAAVRITYSNAAIALPARTEDGWRLNAVGEFFVSTVMGLLANTNPVVTVLAALAAPGMIEMVIHKIQRIFNGARG
jgi:hypothetical protein